MNLQLLSILTIFGSGIFATLMTYLVSMYVNKRKLPVDLESIKATTNLTGGEIIEKYQEIATKQADKNILLEKQLEDQDQQSIAEKGLMMNEIKKLREEMLTLDKISEGKIIVLTQQLVECRAELKKSTDYITRLLAQLCSWRIEPVPFEIEYSRDAGAITKSKPYPREGENKNGNETESKTA